MQIGSQDHLRKNVFIRINFFFWNHSNDSFECFAEPNNSFFIHSIENFGQSFIFHSFDRKFRTIIHFSFIRSKISDNHSFFIHSVLRKIIRLKMNYSFEWIIFSIIDFFISQRATARNHYFLSAHVVACCMFAAAGEPCIRNSLLGPISAFAFLNKMTVRSLLTLHPESLHNLLSDHHCSYIYRKGW